MRLFVMYQLAKSNAWRPFRQTWMAKIAAARTALWVVLCAGLLWVVGTAPAFPDVITLVDQNSTATIDTSSQAGLYNWSVNGVNQIQQEWFWYRIGSGTASSIDTLGNSSISQAAPDQATVTYSGTNGLTASVTYTLEGNNPDGNGAQLGEQLVLSNTNSSLMDLHFFEYANFRLNNGSGPNVDTVTFSSANEVDQQEVGGATMSETEIAPAPNRREADAVYSTLNNLNSTFGFQLSQNNKSPAALPGPYGPGDMSWAYEWDKSLGAAGAPDNSLAISKFKTVSGVPEPSTLALAIVGFVAMVGFARSRRA